MNIILPTKKIIATKKNPRLLLIYGAPKVGKTSLAASLDNSLLLDIEDGSDYVDAVKLKVTSILHLTEIKEEILKQGKPYKYIVVDSATELEVWAEAWGTHLYKESNIGKNFKGDSVLLLPNGAGYFWLRIAYAKALDIIKEMAEHIILIAHVRDKMLVDKKGFEVSTSDLDLTGKLKSITCSKADAVCFIYRKLTGSENGKGVSEIRANFGTNLEVVAGSRCQHLIGQDFTFDWNRIFVLEEGAK